MQYLLGIDGGATKTDFVLCRMDGWVERRLLLDSSNPNDVGLPACLGVLEEGVLRITAGRTVARAFAGISGAGAGQQAAEIAALLHALLPDALVRCDSDAVSALRLSEGDGMTLIAGTGSALFSRVGGETFRVGGWGYLFDDRGGAYAVGRDAVAAALLAFDGRGEETALAGALSQTLGAPAPDALGRIYAGGKRLIASFAPLVFDASARGDAVAQGILRHNAEALASLVVCGGRRFGDGPSPVPVTCVGGLFRYADTLLPMLAALAGPRFAFRLPDLPPVFGAIREALGETAPDAAFVQRFAQTLPTAKPPAPDAAQQRIPKTERRNPRTRCFDRIDSLSMARLMNDEDRHAVDAVRAVLPDVVRAIDRVADAFRHGGRLLYIGAGTSGRLGVLDASECPPTFSVPADQVIGIIAGGERCLTHAGEYAEDDAAQGARDLAAYEPRACDVLVGLSASGGTPYVAEAMRYAKERGLATIAVTSNAGSAITHGADIAICPDTGAEVVTGSTRLKAGTAQKLILNMLTTCSMAKTGKVMENLMINLRPSNEKLRRRVISIVCTLRACGEAEAVRRLEACDWDIRRAVDAQA